MRIVAALGGNALLRRGEPPAAALQRANVQRAVAALAPLAARHELLIAHGNGPQVGLLALERELSATAGPYPLDVLDAETAGMIGYLVQQEMDNVLPRGRTAVALVTQVEIDPSDPAFAHPTKPIGAVYGADEGARLAATRGWSLIADGDGVRRAVASPQPQRIVEIDIIRDLAARGVVVICAGGGGIPVVRTSSGALRGIEAVIDKDLTSAVLAREVSADLLLLLTDVDAVYTGWNTPAARALRQVGTDALAGYAFAAGSMAPKVAAAGAFVSGGRGRAAIGSLADAAAILAGRAGTEIVAGTAVTSWWPARR